MQNINVFKRNEIMEIAYEGVICLFKRFFVLYKYFITNEIKIDFRREFERQRVGVGKILQDFTGITVQGEDIMEKTPHGN